MGDVAREIGLGRRHTRLGMDAWITLLRILGFQSSFFLSFLFYWRTVRFTSLPSPLDLSPHLREDVSTF